jgi:PAS domain-containing protein
MSNMASSQKVVRKKIPPKKKKPWYANLGCCGRKSLTEAMIADEAFWATFYRAYDALCTPVILGEIETDTLDVRIVYANTAACDFTGYGAGEVSTFNPNGLVGRSVTELMEVNLADAHSGFVERWLGRRGIVSSETHGKSSNASQEMDDSIRNNAMKQVEGISRRVAMVTIDGRSLTTDAALSFFTAKGLKKVIGIFSFKSAEDLEVISFKGLTFNLQYRPDKKSKTGYYVVVEPPHSLSQFSDDDAWKVTAVSAGIVLKSGDLKTIKELIRKQIFLHLSKISCGSGLDVTYVEKDAHAVDSRDMRKAHTAIVNSINDSQTQENMHMSAEYRRKGVSDIDQIESIEEWE